jgi:glycosyltransferase involved in cell wall biosynthesis
VVGEPIRVHALIDTLGAGGAELLLPELARVAPDAGLELHVTALNVRDHSPAAARLRGHGVEPTIVPIKSILGPRDIWRVRDEIARVSADIVHTHLGNADFVGGLAARSLGVPLTSTIHADRWIAGRKLRLKLDLMARVRRHCAATVIAVSESSKRAYVAERWDRPEHVQVVHNGIGATPAPGQGAAVRRELGLDPDEQVITMMSTLRPEKGFDVAIEAVQRVRERFPRTRLLIAGRGPWQHGVAELAAAAPEAVLLTGHRDDVMAVLDASDVVLQPSRYDAFPTSILEAMAASAPIVATAVGGIPEMVEDGVSGTLVPAPPQADAIAAALTAMLESGEDRARMAAAARRRFEQRFTAEAWVDRLRAVYEGLLAGRPPARPRPLSFRR